MPRPNRPGSRKLPPDKRNWFDRFAERLAALVAHPLFFLACVLSVVVWAVSGPPADYSSRWQLFINTGTTIVTFLMVALLQNAQRRNEIAMHRKMDAIADALADFMDKSPLDLKQDVKELEEAVWLEKVQSSKGDEDEGQAKKASSGAGDDRKHAGHRDRRRRRSVVARKDG